jgi:hypothetical protein
MIGRLQYPEETPDGNGFQKISDRLGDRGPPGLLGVVRPPAKHAPILDEKIEDRSEPKTNDTGEPARTPPSGMSFEEPPEGIKRPEDSLRG